MRRRQENVIGRHQDLFRFEAELDGNVFQGVDGGAVDIGLAGFS